MDDTPTITLLEALRIELTAYHAKRRAAAAKLNADQPEYAAKVDAMWEAAIRTQEAKIAREEQRCSV